MQGNIKGCLGQITKHGKTGEQDERFAVRFEPDIEECLVSKEKCLVGQEEYVVGQEECLAGQEECLLGQEEGLVGQEQRTIVMVSDHQIMILYDQKHLQTIRNSIYQ